MDKLVAVLQRELANTEGHVILYYEGCFYRAYDRSAYRFVKYVKGYEVKKYHYVNEDYDLCSLGFPRAAYAKLESRPGLRFEPVPDTNMVLLKGNFPPVDEDEYMAWREGITMSERKDAALPGNVPGAAEPPAPVPPRPENSDSLLLTQTERQVIEKIRNYPLAFTNPMNCMMFLAELQEMLEKKQP